ncbi:BTB/POZ domain-containing protein KCTD7-like [Elysia marginata]|uniref:BTB/POZ domain-containing protein KCTD7-like n=1 Tax=Elysia marginata TaxID=1093978 RepID=A0AAV4J3V8_9GAST|nr:BTB/POZ domain-containing protein KCTD7-like [Elysia marginata]
MEEILKDTSEEESDSVEEIVEMKPLPAPRLVTYHQSIPGGWTDRSSSNDSGLPSSARDGSNTLNRQSSTSVFPAIINLNVGGQLYMTRLSTLLKFSDSMLAAMFSGRHQIDKDKDGNFFLDSNGQVFSHILEFLRYGTVPPNDVAYLVFRDANYYGLHELADMLQLRPEIAALAVKQAQRAQFPNYETVKEDVIKAAMARATTSRIGDVYIYAFRKEFKPRAPNFNPKHGCIIESAQVSYGGWDTSADEDIFIRCLENDLMEDGFTLRPHEGKKKCKYYFGQTCPKFIFKITILFD